MISDWLLDEIMGVLDRFLNIAGIDGNVTIAISNPIASYREVYECWYSYDKQTIYMIKYQQNYYQNGNEYESCHLLETPESVFEIEMDRNGNLLDQIFN